uniref:Uncharacterized protein n=1 Tax=Anguilla anguilla TaxID=7936 RepID=A0A0E9TY09_ANGAN
MRACSLPYQITAKTLPWRLRAEVGAESRNGSAGCE